jgi:hypothetical protein
VFVDEENQHIFELLDPLSGETIQHYVLETMFPGHIVKAFLHTWMINEEYYLWNLVGQDDQGGFVSHRMPSLEEEYHSEDTVLQEHDHDSYTETQYEHEEL